MITLDKFFFFFSNKMFKLILSILQDKQVQSYQPNSNYENIPSVVLPDPDTVIGNPEIVAECVKTTANTNNARFHSYGKRTIYYIYTYNNYYYFMTL